MKINFTFFPLSFKLYIWISLYYHGTAPTQILSAVSYIRLKSLLFSPSPQTTPQSRPLVSSFSKRMISFFSHQLCPPLPIHTVPFSVARKMFLKYNLIIWLPNFNLFRELLLPFHLNAVFLPWCMRLRDSFLPIPSLIFPTPSLLKFSPWDNTSGFLLP